MLTREVAIVLASAGFSTEVTTTVLWLNEFYGTDIRCMRLSPYRHENRLLLDVQQVVPLPEAEELTVKLRKRETAARESKAASRRDYTKYVIKSPSGSTAPLAKNWAILAMVKFLHGAGVSMADIAAALPANRVLSVIGSLDGDVLWDAFRAEHAQSEDRRKRWFVEDPIHERERTWVLFSNWGTKTERTLERLREVAPAGFDFWSDGQAD